MTLTANEQYLLELMNRARLDPNAEAARYGIDLNANLAPGTISATAKQVLAPNELLDAAATKHSLWMLSADVFSHTGQGGSSPWDRIKAEGYIFSTAGENIGWAGTTGSVTQLSQIEIIHRGLFLSEGHRVNLMGEGFREVGVSAESGVFTTSRDWNATMVTQDFATRGTARFLTGVAYTDINSNKFYTPGEGTGGVQFSAQGKSTATAAAGGYALATDGTTALAVTGAVGTKGFSATIDMSLGNVKLDVVGGNTFYTSGNITLGSGINNVGLLGVAGLSATGNGLRNGLSGNSGANRLDGLGGNDKLTGGTGADVLLGGAGDDKLTGGGGADALTGGAGGDWFIFQKGGGVDRVTDFNLADLDRLQLDDTLWTGQTLSAAQVVSQFGTVVGGDVVLDFGAEEVRLVGVAGLAGLDGAILIV